MKNFELFLFALAFSFSLSYASSSTSIDDHRPDSEAFITCLKSYSNDHSITKLIFTPSNSSFLPIWQASINNARFNKPSTTRPSFIVTPVDETQIQAAVYCTKKHGYEFRIRSGGHDWEGISSTARFPFVIVDLVNMRAINIDVDNATAWVQAGATLGQFYYAISEKTSKLFFPAGVCPTVGVGGYITGGGYGNLVRKYGLAADNALDVRFMDVNGNILDKNSMGEDLFWAIRGGGGSSFGIILAWKVRLVPVPEKVTLFLVNITLEENLTAIFNKFQYVAPSIDRDLLLRLEITGQKIGNDDKKTVRMLVQGLYLGSPDALLGLIEEKFPELGVTREICQELSMVQTVLVYAGYSSTTDPSILTNRSTAVKMNNKATSDFVRTPIPISGIKKMWKKILENDASDYMVINPFGGRMGDHSETEIPYPHRAGILYQMLASVNLMTESVTSATTRRRVRWLRSFKEELTPYVTQNPREAYVNYNDLDYGVGSDTYEEASAWGERYWNREIFTRLIRIKARVDPENFFRHPQSIPVFKKSL